MHKTLLIFRFARPLLAIIIVTLSFVFAFMLLYKPIPKDNVSTVNLVVGFMLGITASVGAYYFGTSKDKSDYEQQQRTPNTTTETTTTIKQNEPDNEKKDYTVDAAS